MQNTFGLMDQLKGVGADDDPRDQVAQHGAKAEEMKERNDKNCRANKNQGLIYEFIHG